MKKSILKISFLALALGTLFTSCKTEEVDPETGLDVPSTYNFSDVSIGGQIARQDMLDELITYIKSAHKDDASVTLDSIVMLNMFNQGTGFSTSELNESGKKLGDKTAIFFKEKLNNYLIDAAEASTNGMAGVDTAGVLTGFKANGVDTRTILVDSKGFEYAQIAAKGLMGAVFYDQAVNNYLYEIELDPNDNFTEGKGTTMAHHWDEAYGYFTDGLNFPTDGADRFWGTYSEQRDPYTSSSTKIGNAFRTGRAAILANEYDEVKKQRDIIKTEWSKLAAACVIHYLNSGKANYNNIDRFHALSEGYGFLMAVKAAGGDVNAMIETFETKGLHKITENELTAFANELATEFDLLSVQSDL